MIEPTGTSRICSASMMIGIGHLRPSASIVSSAAGVTGVLGAVISPARSRLPNKLTITIVPRAFRGYAREYARNSGDRDEWPAEDIPRNAGGPRASRRLARYCFHDTL